MLKSFLAFVLLYQTINAYKYSCSQRSSTLLLKRPTYEYSMRILQRVAEETGDNFVFSPLSSWLQLVSLAEGASNKTAREIWKVTRHHRNICFKRKLSFILNKMDRDLKYQARRQNFIVIDKFMDVKKRFIRNVKLYGAKTILCDFSDLSRSADLVNKFAKPYTHGKIVYDDDFNNTLMIISEATHFRSAWRYPFNVKSTKRQPFYETKNVKQGEVFMMNQLAYLNVTDFPLINSRILELPCKDGRFSMLVFLPTRNIWVGDLFYSLQSTQLTSIFNMFKHNGVKLVNVSIPRFSITTNVENIPELLYDMGVKRVFDPDKAELGRISNYKIYPSFITQTAQIEVTERGVRAEESPGNLSKDNRAVNFIANKPFAFMIVDRETKFILYAGVYSSPSVY